MASRRKSRRCVSIRLKVYPVIFFPSSAWHSQFFYFICDAIPIVSQRGARKGRGGAESLAKPVDSRTVCRRQTRADKAQRVRLGKHSRVGSCAVSFCLLLFTRAPTPFFSAASHLFLPARVPSIRPSATCVLCPCPCHQGDFSRQNKTINKAVERFMPVPDSVLQTAAATVATSATADTTMLGASSSISGSGGGATPYTDFMQIGGARKQVLGLNLDRVRSPFSYLYSV